MTTKKLALTETANGQANYLSVNEALQKLDQIVQAGAVDKDLATPPGSPADGALYIVASGNWGTASSKAKQLAYWLDSAGAWGFIVPLTGWRVTVLDELDGNGVPKAYAYNGTDWVIPENTAVAAPSATVTDSTTSRTLGLGDAGSYIRMTNASASVVTVPPQSSVAWADDTEIHIRRAGAGDLTLTEGSGVDLIQPSGGTLVMTNAMTVTLKRVASDTWDVIGQTVAV